MKHDNEQQYCPHFPSYYRGANVLTVNNQPTKIFNVYMEEIAFKYKMSHLNIRCFKRCLKGKNRITRDSTNLYFYLMTLFGIFHFTIFVS